MGLCIQWQDVLDGAVIAVALVIVPTYVPLVFYFFYHKEGHHED